MGGVGKSAVNIGRFGEYWLPAIGFFIAHQLILYLRLMPSEGASFQEAVNAGQTKGFQSSKSTESLSVSYDYFSTSSDFEGWGTFKETMEDLKFPARVYTNGKIIRMNQGDFDKLYRKKVEQLGKNPSKVNDEKSSVSLVSDELTHNQRVEQAENQNRDKNGRFSKEGDTEWHNQEEREGLEEQNEDIFYIDRQKEIENCKALYSVDEMQKFEDKKKARMDERIQYEKYWCELNLEDTVKQFLSNAIREPANKNGKIYYTNGSNIIIDYDVFGDYFRIFDKTKKIKQAYLMIDENSLKSKKDILKANPHIVSDKAFMDKFLAESHYKRI